MMLLEPGSKIEGDTEQVLTTIHRELFRMRTAEGLTESDAYDQAERDTALMLEALIRAGHVVRHIEHTAWVRGRIEAKAVNAALMDSTR